MKKIFTNRLTTLLALVLCTVAVLANNKDYKSTVKAIANPSAAGKVYVSVSNGTNGSEGATSTATKTESTNEAPSHSYTLKATTTDNGYSWQGWYTKENGGGTRKSQDQTYSGFSVTAAEGDGKTETLYAYWTANTYTVTFDGNEGTPSEASKSVTYGSTYGDLPSATRRFYDFDGWFTDATDGSRVTSETKVATASNHSLFAHWTLAPEHQTLTFDDGMQFSMAKGTRQAIAVTSTSGLTDFTYASDNDEVIHINGEYLEAVGNGEATITVYQAGNTYFYSDSVKHIFSVMSKETPFFFENGFTDSETNELKVGDRVTLNVDKVSEGLDGDFTVTANTADVMGIAREGNVITFSALHTGTVTITVNQAANEDIYAASKTYTFNVTRYVPEFALSATELVLEQAATLTLTNTDAPVIAFNPTGIVAYDGNTGTITATAVGTTTLTISQAETNSVEAKDSTFEITVSKKNPTLTVKMNGEERTTLSIMQGRTATVAFESNSEGNLTVSNVRGSQYASYINGTMTAGAVGEAVYRVTLDETDTFKGTYKDFTLTVTKDQEAVPVSGKSYTLGHATEMDWRGESATLHFNGVPDKLNFKYVYNYRSDLGKTSLKCPDYLLTVSDDKKGKDNVYMMFVEESPDNVNWTMIWNNSDPFKDNPKSIEQPITLQKTTRYVRFNHTANFSSTYSDISISELKFVDDPNPNTIDFGSAVINSGEVTKTSVIQWCNIAPLSVTCANPRFKVTPSTIGNFGTYGTTEIQISYTHTNEESDEQADVVISNGTYSKTIHVSAKTIKRPQTITWNNYLSSTGFAMNVDEQYPDSSILAIATSTNGGRVTFTSDNDTVVKVVADTALLAVGIGNANITAHQAGDVEYQDVSDTQKFTVTLKQKQSITWNQTFYDLLTTSAPRELDAWATSLGEITYTSANPAVVSIDGNILTVVGEGETYITATQAGGVDSTGIDWLEVSQSNYVVVRDPNSECSGVMLSVGSLTLSSSKKEQEYTLTGIPSTITFTAKHGTKSGAWGTTPSYSSLLVDEYAYIDGQLDWHNVFEKVVGTEAKTYGGDDDSIRLSRTATKIRVRTLESGTDHTITSLQVKYAKYLTPDIEQVSTEVESNSTWKQKIVVSHSNIDFISVYTTRGLLNLSESTIGEGCYDYTDDEFVASFTPAIKNYEYFDTIVITDRKTNHSTVEIPVRLYSKGLNQSISGFELPTAALTTDEIQVSATASSELEVLFHSSDSTIAYVGADSTLVILKDGQVTITATQEGNDKYDAAQPVEQTIVISKAPVTITTAPTAAALTYGQALSESALTNGAATVDGEFAWEAPQTIPAAGTPTYAVVFTPAQRNIYATATTLVSVRVEQATPEVTTYPTASDITIAQSVGESQLTGGEATVEGTFAWKNPEERRLLAGAYTRTVIFTPTDVNYNSVEISVNFNVINVLARITEQPTTVAENAVYGITLADVTLVGGSANVEGAFSWRDSTIVPQAGTHAYPVLFTPEDLELYAVVNIDVDVTIAKATPAIETLPIASSILYGAALAEAELTDGAASVEGEFAWVDGTLQLNAGEHTEAIIFMPTDSANYNAVEDTVAVLVGQAPLTVTAEDKAVIFGDEIPEYTAVYDGFVNGENEQVLLGELAFACEYTPSSEVGEYTITPSGLTADNYAITFVDGLLTVNKTAATVVAPTALELTYTGKAQELVAAGSSEHGELQYRLGEEGEWGTNIPTAVDAGDYSVFYQLIGDDSHADVEATEVLAHIAKADVEIIAVAAAGELSYGQKLQTAQLSGEATAEGTFAWVDGDTILVVGEHTLAVLFTPADTANYNAAVTEATVQVNKIDAVLLFAPVAKEHIIYTGEARELVVAGLVEGGTLEYSLNAENWSAELPTAVEAGDYTVYYRIVGDANHNDLDGDVISATIIAPEPDKEYQYITWNDQFDEAIDVVEGMFFLDATTSSGLPVSFTSSDSTVAYVEELDGFYFLYLLKRGVVTITARQDGNDTYSAAEPIAKVINIISDEEDPETPTAVEDAQTAIKVQKIIRDNQVLIIREGRTYTTTGLLVE